MQLPGVNVFTAMLERNLTAQQKKKKNNLPLQMQRTLYRIKLKNNSVAASDYIAGQIVHTHSLSHSVLVGCRVATGV